MFRGRSNGQFFGKLNGQKIGKLNGQNFGEQCSGEDPMANFLVNSMAKILVNSMAKILVNNVQGKIQWPIFWSRQTIASIKKTMYKYKTPLS